MPSNQERLIGAQFDDLDKGVARRGADLLSRSTIAKQTYDEWITDLNQLADFASQYGGVSYVSSKWSAELPRYQQVDAAMQSRIVVANPNNYNPTVSISGGGCCDDCGKTKIPTLPYTPLGNYGSNGLGSTFFGGDTLFGTPSLGDGLRANMIPFQQLPSNPPLVDKSNFITSLLVAVVFTGILWGVHYATKKKIV